MVAMIICQFCWQKKKFNENFERAGNDLKNVKKKKYFDLTVLPLNKLLDNKIFVAYGSFYSCYALSLAIS